MDSFSVACHAEDDSEVIYRHFHEEEPSSELPYTRRQDGLYETSVRKRLDNPYFSVGAFAIIIQ